jgi:FkbM family methyltransferase
MLFKLAGLTARILPGPLRRSMYRLGPLSRLMRKSLNRAVPRGRATVSVAAGPLQGLRLRLDLSQEKDCWLGTYEPELQAAISAFVQPGMTAYDVGANIGYISLMLAGAVGPGGRVFAFEALPDNIERLCENLALNGLAERVEVIPAAIVDRSRTAEFLVHASASMGKAVGSGGRGEAYEKSLPVAGLSLDDYVYGQGHSPPQVVKLDIEGGELLALPGMSRLLEEARPLVFLELHGQESAQAAWRIFNHAGYTLARMEKNYPTLAGLDELDWKAYLLARPQAESGSGP